MDNPRGVSSHHVLVRAFGDALCRREKVRHATLLFRAEGRMCPVELARERKVVYVYAFVRHIQIDT